MTDEHPFLKVLHAAGLYRRNGSPVPQVDLSELPTADAGDPSAQRYAEKALEYEADEVAAATEGTRNHTLNKAAYKLGSLVSAGHLDGQTVINTLEASARISGLPPSEINRVVYRATREGGQTPREVRLEPMDGATPAHTLDLVTTSTDNGSQHQHDTEQDNIVATVGDITTMYPILHWPTVWEQTPDDVEWLAYPLLERGRLYSLYSPAKAGKSLLTLDICAALATGNSALGQPAGDPVTVLYVDLENSPADLVDRLQAFGYGPHDLDRLAYMSFPSLPALDSRVGGMHLVAAARYHGAEVVVIDTVSRMISGGENDSDTFHALYRYAMAPLKAAGVTVLRLDHAGKNEEKGMRGSSAKISDVDAAWKLSRTGEGRIQLDRAASRNANSPESVAVDVKTSPLRHVLIDEGLDDATSRLVVTLDHLSIPSDWGRRRIRKALAEQGYKIGDHALGKALRARKTSFTEAS